jgi:hypothetical protein
VVKAYLAFNIPAETAALDAAVRAVERPTTAPVLVNGAGKHAGAEADAMAELSALEEDTPDTGSKAEAPKRRGRPRKASKPAPVEEPVIAAALPVPRVIDAPVAEAHPDPGAVEATLRQELGFEALRVARIMSVPAMRSLLQKVAGEECMSVADVPAPLLAAAITEFKATA